MQEMLNIAFFLTPSVCLNTVLILALALHFVGDTNVPANHRTDSTLKSSTPSVPGEWCGTELHGRNNVLTHCDHANGQCFLWQSVKLELVYLFFKGCLFQTNHHLPKVMPFSTDQMFLFHVIASTGTFIWDNILQCMNYVAWRDRRPRFF